MNELEIEIKAYCDDLQGVKQKIEALGAVFVKSEKEVDMYFNHPCKDFGHTDEALRIRSVDNKYILTYKGPKVSKKSKARIEKETGLQDRHVSKEILMLLGFKESGTVSKKRLYYTLDDIIICLDEVEKLGDFVELEMPGNEPELIESKLFSLAEKIDLSRFERRSYLELLLASQ